MRLAPRTSFLPCTLLVLASLAGCDGKPAAKTSTQAAAKPASGTDPASPDAKPLAFAPPKAQPGPGERGYVAPVSNKQTPALIQATVKGNIEAVKALLD